MMFNSTFGVTKKFFMVYINACGKVNTMTLPADTKSLATESGRALCGANGWTFSSVQLDK